MQPDADSIWLIRKEDRDTYDKIFVYFDKNKTGNLTDSEMQEVMAQTKMPREVCAHIWELSNPNGEEIFSKPMFLIAMHLMYKKRKDSTL
jgi:Ca2+-binding EF-hand superfamily protein